MRLSKGLLLGGLAALAGSVWLWAYGCDERVTQPWPPPELSDYRVWFMNYGESGKVTPYAYHPTTHAIDTFDVIELEWSPIASADGSLLFLSSSIEGVTRVLETDSLHMVAELPYGIITAVSPDGRYISAIVRDGLSVLRTSDYSVAFHDSAGSVHTWFSTDSRTLYAVSNQVLKVTFTDTGEVVERKPFDLTSVVQIVSTPDESKWLIYARLPPLWTYIFEVYDVATDSIIFSEVQRPGGGHIAMTPDGRYAFYGNPGTLSPGPLPDTSFTVFDIEANAIDRVVPIKRPINGVEAPSPYVIGDMLVTPDNRWLVVLDALPPHQLLLYDLERQRWVDYHEFGTHNVALDHLTVQLAP